MAVEKADAVDWLEARLAEPAPGVATVVFHSLFIHFLDEQRRARLEAALEAAGRRASKQAPLAWLSLEWGTARHARAVPHDLAGNEAQAGDHG